jgi:hypothetical protein
MKQHLDSVTSPNISIPIVGVTGFMNFLEGNLPLIINICTVVYLGLLISHKAYQMYKEIKGKDESSK